MRRRGLNEAEVIRVLRQPQQVVPAGKDAKSINRKSKAAGCCYVSLSKKLLPFIMW
jgi:hypothetical protein